MFKKGGREKARKSALILQYELMRSYISIDCYTLY
jgi:hypothetical protein